MKGIISKPVSFFVLLLFIALSCNSNRKAVRSEVESLIGSRIRIPNDLVCKYNGLDTSFVIEDNIKMLIYYDSISCSPCLMNQMFEWSDVIYHSETIASPFPIYFIFNPSEHEYHTLVKMLKLQSFDYPVFIDTTGSLAKQNPTIDLYRWHCFLLDKNNKVALVGTPINNRELWDLYKNTIYELIANGGHIKH